MISVNIKRQFLCDKRKLWDIVTDNKNYSWRSDVLRIDIVDDTHFIEYGKGEYKTFFTITKKEVGDVYQFELENTNLKGIWIGTFTEISSGLVELSFTEEIEVHSKVMRIFAKGYLKKQQKRYMDDLEKAISIKREYEK